MTQSAQLLPLSAEETGFTAEKREHRRQTVMLRAALFPIDTVRDIIVRDVSISGIQGETDVELLVGQPLYVSFDERIFQEGCVRWTRGMRFGLKLEEPLPLAVAPLEVETGDDGQAPRPRRVEKNLGARIATGRPPRPAIVRNLSPAGMMLETSPGLLEGQAVIVRLSGRPSVLGRVQWTDDGCLGIKTYQYPAAAAAGQ